MSKDQNQNKEKIVETVEKFKKEGTTISSYEIFEWISSTLKFWHEDEKWPMNFIVTFCDSVSRSHINDK